jgi:hypothetical protein
MCQNWLRETLEIDLADLWRDAEFTEDLLRGDIGSYPPNELVDEYTKISFYIFECRNSLMIA